MTGDDVTEGVSEILMNAEAAVCEELNTALSVRATFTFFYIMLSDHFNFDHLVFLVTLELDLACDMHTFCE